jgi:hypothetical protein
MVAFARRSDRPKQPGRQFEARYALYLCHPRLVNGYPADSPRRPSPGHRSRCRIDCMRMKPGRQPRRSSPGGTGPAVAGTPTVSSGTPPRGSAPEPGSVEAESGAPGFRRATSRPQTMEADRRIAESSSCSQGAGRKTVRVHGSRVTTVHQRTRCGRRKADPAATGGMQRRRVRRCRRTEARNATGGSDDRATSSRAVESNRPPRTDLDGQTT